MAASRHGYCHSSLKEFLQGVHQPGDTYKLALYASNAALDVSTKSYSSQGEVSGPGYKAGGATLEGIQFSDEEGGACMGWKNSPRWEHATIKARRALIYNASKQGRALAVLDFGEDKASSSGPWFIKPGQLQDVIQLGG